MEKDCFSEPLTLNARGSCPGSVTLTESKVLNFFYLDPPYVPLKNTSFTEYNHPNLISTPKISNAKRSETKFSSEVPSISSLSTFSSKQSHLNFFSYVESLIKTNTNFPWCSVWSTQSEGETHVKDTTSETKVFSQPMLLNGSSITTQFLITNSNTPLVNE